MTPDETLSARLATLLEARPTSGPDTLAWKEKFVADTMEWHFLPSPFATSLEACAEAESELERRGLHLLCVNELALLTGKEHEYRFTDAWAWSIAHASAAQRTRAMIETLEQAQESKVKQ